MTIKTSWFPRYFNIILHFAESPFEKLKVNICKNQILNLTFIVAVLGTKTSAIDSILDVLCPKIKNKK